MGGDVAGRLTRQERLDIAILAETCAVLLASSAKAGLVSAESTQMGWARLARINEMIWNDEMEEEQGNGYSHD